MDDILHLLVASTTQELLLRRLRHIVRASRRRCGRALALGRSSVWSVGYVLTSDYALVSHRQIEDDGNGRYRATSRRELRADAIANRDRVLAAAVRAVRRDGEAVPLATIAAEAGVGIATLYRSYPSREALLAALTRRSFGLVLDAAQRAADGGVSAIESVAMFLHQTIDHGPRLVLPLHGGPVALDQDTVALQSSVHDTLHQILERGRRDGSVRPNVTVMDIVLFGAMIARPLPHVSDWNLAARRQVAVFLSGIEATAPAAPQ